MRKFFVIIISVIVVCATVSGVFADSHESEEEKTQNPCATEQACDPSQICPQVLTCVDGQLYPTACGPDNCDEPIGPCENGEGQTESQ